MCVHALSALDVFRSLPFHQPSSPYPTHPWQKRLAPIIIIQLPIPKNAAAKTNGYLRTLAILGVFLLGLPLCPDTAVVVVAVEVALDATTRSRPSPPNPLLLLPEGGKSNGSSSIVLYDLERRRGEGGAANATFPFLALVLLARYCLDISLVPGPPVAMVVDAVSGVTIPSSIFSVDDACLHAAQAASYLSRNCR